MRTATKHRSQIDKVSISLALDTQSPYLFGKITHFFEPKIKSSISVEKSIFIRKIRNSNYIRLPIQRRFFFSN